MARNQRSTPHAVTRRVEVFAGSDDGEISLFELDDEEAAAFMNVFWILNRSTERADDAEEELI
jgi:hypothetical protein